MRAFQLSLSLLFASVALSACSELRQRNHFHLAIADAKGESPFEAAGKITQAYYSQRRFLQVTSPTVQSPTESQITASMSMAVVQPASGSGESVLMACTVHEPSPTLAAQMLDRCEGQLREVAASLGFALAPTRE
jgi:hypothetical protein